jgi:hypothetical protein
MGNEGNCQFTYRKSSLTYIELENLVVDLVGALLSLPATRLLPSNSGNKNLLGDLLRLYSNSLLR